MPANPVNQSNSQIQNNFDKIVRDRLEQERYSFSGRAKHYLRWVLKTGGLKISEDATPDSDKVQIAEKHLNELMDSILAHAKTRNETDLISFASVELACRDNVGRMWPF